MLTLVTTIHGAGDALELISAHLWHPERFVRKPPAPPELPIAAWISKPRCEEAVAHCSNAKRFTKLDTLREQRRPTPAFMSQRNSDG